MVWCRWGNIYWKKYTSLFLTPSPKLSKGGRRRSLFEPALPPLQPLRPRGKLGGEGEKGGGNYLQYFYYLFCFDFSVPPPTSNFLEEEGAALLEPAFPSPPFVFDFSCVIFSVASRTIAFCRITIAVSVPPPSPVPIPVSVPIWTPIKFPILFSIEFQKV